MVNRHGGLIHMNNRNMKLVGIQHKIFSIGRMTKEKF